MSGAGEQARPGPVLRGAAGWAGKDSRRIGQTSTSRPGLEPGLVYRVSRWPDGGSAPERLGADILTAVGLPVRPDDPRAVAAEGDFAARMWVLEAE
ncbi:MAG: hypothetical protein HYX57_01650 [Chloroflexi bacterium]|nr:hypothetical protein [Chloroflexota bacterium]